MPLFRVQVNYRQGLAAKWSNVWHVTADNLLDAADAFDNVGVPELLPILNTSCEIASLLVSSLTDDSFITRPINTAGTSPLTASLLPLFNSVKVYLTDLSNGRPDYKYFKGVITEEVTDDGLLASGFMTDVQNAILTLAADMNTAGAPLTSTDGDNYTGVVVQEAVQMRQMHRKRRRVVAP